VCVNFTVGIAITTPTTGSTGFDFSTASVLADYSFVTEMGAGSLITHCFTGMGPNGAGGNNELGGWYFNGTQITNGVCNGGLVVQQRAAPINEFIGAVDLNQCQAFTTDFEGVYSCMMMNSSMMEQTMRVGVYFTGRSESLDMYRSHHC